MTDKKTCTKCKIEKDVSFFYKQGKYLQSHCKTCDKEKVTNRRRNNPEKNREIVKKWKANNRKKVNDIQKKYRLNNFEKEKERSKNWNLNNKVKAKESKRNYYLNNQEMYLNNTAVQYFTQNKLIKHADIPPELIEIKKIQILINRELKEAQHAKC
jgi:hypothetical protein